jgi:hypothetical protein
MYRSSAGLWSSTLTSMYLSSADQGSSRLEIDLLLLCRLGIVSHWLVCIVSLQFKHLLTLITRCLFLRSGIVSLRSTSLLCSLGIVSHFIAMYRSSTAKYGNIVFFYCTSILLLHNTVGTTACLLVWKVIWFYYTSNLMWYNIRIKHDEVGNMNFITHQTNEMIPEVHTSISVHCQGNMILQWVFNTY